MNETLPLEDALIVLGEVLEDRGLSYELVLIGGGALYLLGLISRPTQDLDAVARIVDDRWQASEPFPAPLTAAVAEVAAALDLSERWLNPAASGLREAHGLPKGFVERAHQRRYGSLGIWLAAREDQICLKLDAAADHWSGSGESRHLQDLRALNASGRELQDARAWCLEHRAPTRIQDLDEVIAELLFGGTP